LAEAFTSSFALLLTGISIQALAEIDAGKGHEGRPATLQELSDQLQVLLRDCQGLQGEDGVLVFIAKKLQSQVSKDKRQCFIAIRVFLLLKDTRIRRRDPLQIERAQSD
jgi:hypothetical protein